MRFGRKLRPALSGGKTQAKIDGVVRRGLAKQATGAARPDKAAAPARGSDDDFGNGFNPYDTLGPEILERHRPRPAGRSSTPRSGGQCNPYDTASQSERKRRSWDDAVIDTAERR